VLRAEKHLDRNLPDLSAHAGKRRKASETSSETAGEGES
jgi:hypothetical protein